MDRLKRRNEIDAMNIVREFHDYELVKMEPDEEFMGLCKRLIELVESRHKREDANGKAAK